MGPGVGGSGVLSRGDFPRLLTALSSAGYRVVGPTVRDGAIVYGDIRSEDDLPVGWTDRSEAGKYRIERRADSALFGYNVGPHSWKKYLFPAHERLWTAHKVGETFRVVPEKLEAPPLAFLGVRACEIAAIEIQDKVFHGASPDPAYATRRERSLVVAVNCGQAASTCFCTSMRTGPKVERGYDLALTELLTDGPHRFLLEVGSSRGAAIVSELPLVPRDEPDRVAAEAAVAHAVATMGRRLDTTGIRDLLLTQPEHPRWETVASRCLSCANCTMACPTCFCSTTEEVPDLEGATSERWRRWDSCFNLAFSELHLTSVRKSTMSRYRQWLTHKLASWHDQFGVSGCVGCGRCIAWCPVGIDLTEEVAAIRASPMATAPPGAPG